MVELLVAGVAAGCTYALLAVAIVLMYRIAGVLNFAQSVIGVFGAYITVSLAEHGIAYIWSVALGVIASALLAALLAGAFAQFFREAGAITRSTVSIAVTVSLLALIYRIFGDYPRFFPAFLPGVQLILGGVAIPPATILILLIACGWVAVAELSFRFTSIGVRLLAISQRPVTAELLGIPVASLTTLVWAVCGATSAFAIVAVAPLRQNDPLILSLLVLPAMAAALVGGFTRLGHALVAGLFLGVLESAITSWNGASTLRSLIPFAVVIAVLLWSQRREVWGEAR